MPKKLLLADDSVTIQKVVELTFATPDYEVKVVGNGDEALAALEADPPDLVIADIHMPGASGLEVATRAKSRRPDLPVLLLAGTFEPFDEAEAAASGADGHLMKPFDAEVLRRRVEEMMASVVHSTTPASQADGASKAEPESVDTTSTVAPAAPSAAAPVDDATPGSVPREVELSSRQIEEIARRVAELVGEKIMKDVAWEVIPEVAEGVIRERLRELEAQVDTADS